jgi:hypothetical protein
MDTNTNTGTLPVVKFSFNWNNKLNNHAFTTLRLHNPGKYLPGQRYQIELKGQPTGTAVLFEKRTVKMQDLNNFVCYLDTGYNRTETIGIFKRMYKGIELTALLDFCLFVYDKPGE